MSNSGAIKAGRAYVEIYGDQTPLQKTLASLPRGFMTASAAIGGVAGVVGGAVVGAVGAAIDAVSNLVNSYGELGGRLTDMSDRTGLSTETLGELDYAATKSGTSLETLEGSLAKMGNKLVDAAAGSKTARAAFATLGLSVEQLSQLSPDQQFERIAQAISEIDDPAARTAAAMDVFGKSGADLLPLMKDGAEGIQAFREEAVDLGRLSGRDVDALDQLSDTFETLGIGAYNAGATVMAAFAPVLTDLGETLLPVVVRIADTAATVGRVVKAVLDAHPPIATLTSTVEAMGRGFEESMASMGEWGQTVNTALASVGGMFDGMYDHATATIQGMIDSLLVGDVVAALEVLGASLDVAWQDALAALGIDWVEIWATILDTFNQASGNIAAAWVSWTSSLSQFWNDLVATLADTWDYFVSGLIKTFAWIEEKLGLISEEQAKLLKDDADGTRDHLVSRRNERNEAANQKLSEDQRAQQQAIQQQRDARTAAIRNDAETNTAEKRRADARARFDELTKQAADRRSAVEAASLAARAQDSAVKGGQMFAGTAEVASTVQFGAAGAALSGGGGVFSKIEEATQETAENTKRMDDHLRTATEISE